MLLFTQTASAAASSYFWTSSSAIVRSGTDGAMFTQITKDDNGDPLNVPNGYVVLESNHDKFSCQNFSGAKQPGASYDGEAWIMRDRYAAFKTMNIPPTLNSMIDATNSMIKENLDGVTSNNANRSPNSNPANYAMFGNGEILVVNTSSTAAALVQFPSSCDGSSGTVPSGYAVTLNTQLAARWTSDSPPTVQAFGQTFTYDQKGVTNGVMTLTGPKNMTIGQWSSTCAPAPTLTVGDSNNSFLSASTATLTFGSASSGEGQSYCTQVTNTIPFAYDGKGNIQSFMATQTVMDWKDPSGNTANADPGAWLSIIHAGSDSALSTSITISTIGCVTSDPTCKNGTGSTTVTRTTDSFSEGIKGINGNTMTLQDLFTFPTGTACAGKQDQVVLNPYATTYIGVITLYTPSGGSCQATTIYAGLYTLYGGTPTSTPTGSNPVTTSDGCNVPTTEALRWIECPIISNLQGFASSVNGFIGQQLSVPNGIFFNSSTQNVYNVFRNIGVSMLVLAGLVMVVSQAADLEIFAAHTVRKALPRIVIVAILIALSWPLLQYVISFFNDIGFWTGKIILSVTSYTNAGGGDAGTIMSNIGDTLIIGLVATAGILFLGAGGIISLIFSFILFIIVGIFVLMIRQVIILLCVLITPVALASFVLPGTEKIGKFWQDTFITALVMFPLVEGFLAAGTALASIILAVKSGDYGYHILAMLVFIAPYLALPFAFKLAGGLVGRVVDFAQGAHHKTIESRLQGYRQNTMAKNTKALQAGSRWNPNSRWTTALGGHGVNFLGRHIGAGMRGRFGLGAVGQAAMANNMALSADAASKMDSNFAAQMNNEEAMAAVAFGNDANRLRSLKYFADKTYDPTTGRTVGENRVRSALAAGQTIQATQQMQTAAADALIRSGKILENRNEFDAMVDSISHGNTALAGGQRGALQYTARQIGREDIGRSNDYEALKEMDMATVARQKPKSLENLFGGKQIITALNKAGSRAEQQHFVDILYAAHQNQSLSPEQQRQVSEAVATVQGHSYYGIAGRNLWDEAKKNYTSKISPGTPSDRRLKQHIQHVQTLSNGIKLYSFQYKWGGSYYVGVMAQDILESHPDVVVSGSDGYYRVRYDLLGLEMKALKEWQTTPNIY